MHVAHVSTEVIIYHGMAVAMAYNVTYNVHHLMAVVHDCN
jgi:hypothetical protein